MTKINPFYSAMTYGTMLTSLDKMGINPMLVIRQTARLLKPQLGDIARQAIGQTASSKIEELVGQIEQFGNMSGVAEPGALK